MKTPTHWKQGDPVSNAVVQTVIVFTEWWVEAENAPSRNPAQQWAVNLREDIGVLEFRDLLIYLAAEAERAYDSMPEDFVPWDAWDLETLPEALDEWVASRKECVANYFAAKAFRNDDGNWFPYEADHQPTMYDIVKAMLERHE